MGLSTNVLAKFFSSSSPPILTHGGGSYLVDPPLILSNVLEKFSEKIYIFQVPPIAYSGRPTGRKSRGTLN